MDKSAPTTTPSGEAPPDANGEVGSFDHASRAKEAELRHAEFGVIGWVENDESGYDSRHGASSSSFKAHPSLLKSSIRNNTQKSRVSFHEGKMEQVDNQHISFSKKLYGRDKEIAQLEQVYQRAMGIDKENENSQKNYDAEQSKNAAQQTPLQIVFLKGFSGSGKTTLVLEAVHRIEKRLLDDNKDTTAQINSSNKLLLEHEKSKAHILIHGKYDQQHHIPYKALSQALNRWYRRLSESQKNGLTDVQKDLEEMIGGEDAQNLAEILPRLSKLITGYDNNENDNDASHASSTRAGQTDNYGDGTINTTRVQFAFQCLFRSLCRYSEVPLIIFLDDLQWADSYSIDLLASLLSPEEEKDQEISRLVFVGAYRQNEVTPKLKQLLETLQGNHANAQHQERQQQDSPSSITSNSPILSLTISDLSREHLRDFVADTLQLSMEEVTPLADAIFSKTMGNMFFARQALEELVRKNALYYDMMTFQWQWVETSEEKLARSLVGNISEMVQSKIQALPMELQHILVAASYLGQHFDIEILNDILNVTTRVVVTTETETEAAIDVTTLGLLLDRAVDEGLLAKSEDGSGSVDYSFAHDHVQEATQFMIFKEESYHDHDHDQLLLDIGKVLVQKSMDDKDATVITDRTTFFLGMHHLNMGTRAKIDSQEEVIRFSRLNLQAAKESVAEAAFESAVEFAKRGIGSIDANYKGEIWQSHDRELMHELHHVAAEACRLSGDLASMESYCRACLAAEKDRPLDELFPIYFTLASGLSYGAQTEGHDEAKDILLKLLQHRGCKMPRTTVGKALPLVREVLSLILFKKRWKTGTIENMGFVQDSKQIETVQLAQKLGELSYMTSDASTTLLSNFRRLNHCLKHGMTVFAPTDVASIALVLAGILNDFQSAKAYAEYATKMMKRLNYKPTEAAARFLIYFFGLPWTTPVADCVGPLRVGYQTGANTGMKEQATWCAYAGMMLAFQAGCLLGEVYAVGMKHLSRMETWGVIPQKSLIKALLEMISSLQLTSANEIFISEEDRSWRRNAAAYKRIEWTLLGDHESCADSVVQDKDDLVKATPGNAGVHVDLFMSGVSCFQMYRTTRMKKYRKEAKRIDCLITKWGKQGNPNVLHWIQLFEAENAFIKHRAKVADEKYSLAIKLALDGGYKQDAAIFYERWGMCTLEMANDKDKVPKGANSTSKAAERLQEAVRLYSMWGAIEVVRRLKVRYPTLLPSHSSSLHI